MCQQYPDSGTLPFIDFTSDEINAPPAKPNIGTDFTDALETKQEVMNTTVISGYKRSASQQESSSNFRYVTIFIQFVGGYSNIPTGSNILFYYLRTMETTCNSGPPVKKSKSNSVQSACADKNPVMILNELRTGLKYECTELGDTPTTKRSILCHYSIVPSN